MKNQADSLNDLRKKLNSKTNISLFFGDINFYPSTLLANIGYLLSNSDEAKILITETSLEENSELNLEGFFPSIDKKNKGNLSFSKYAKKLFYLSPKVTNLNNEIFVKLIKNIKMEEEFSNILIDVSKAFPTKLVQFANDIILFQDEKFKSIKKNYILIKQLKETLPEEIFNKIEFKIIFVSSVAGLKEKDCFSFVEDFIELSESNNVSYLTSLRINERVLKRTSLLKNFFLNNIEEDLEETKNIQEIDTSEQFEIFNKFKKLTEKI
ncbi:hypothetical protein HOK00_00045 [bacterium]|jgi:hypothetical protein|nr:hypothetical protein [bacterium]